MPIIRWNILTILKIKKEGKKKMSIKIALAGNPNSGKTTLFNGLTGSNQFVGNWPGVTVEKKEGISAKPCPNRPSWACCCNRMRQCASSKRMPSASCSIWETAGKWRKMAMVRGFSFPAVLIVTLVVPLPPAVGRSAGKLKSYGIT